MPWSTTVVVKTPAGTSTLKCEEISDEQLEENEPKEQLEPGISLHALTG